MEELSKEEKQEILDYFGEIIIKEVRDSSLKVPMNIVKYKTVNPIDLKRYKVFSAFSQEQQEAVCDLLSATITSTIYYFLEMFEENEDKMKLVITKDGKEYNMLDISEKMGSEIACYEDKGWIQKFSKIGRFVL